MQKTLVEKHYHRIRKHALRHATEAVETFHSTHRHARKLLKKHRIVLDKVREHSSRSVFIAAASASILAAPVIGVTAPSASAHINSTQSSLAHELITDQQQKLKLPIVPVATTKYGPDGSLASLAAVIPQKISSIAPTYTPNMSAAQEDQMAALIKSVYGIDAAASLDGIRLNATQGIIAGEQHLPLYPGDTLDSHTSDPTRTLTGMVPGLPSWGYFAPNRASVTQKDINEERYYMAAQTFMAPGWQQNYQQLYQWFKYRTMIIINPETGQAVVADIADSGPGLSTKRTFGGSNEVLMGLGLGEKRTGHVYVFFVKDGDSVPLGPLGAK